MSAPRYAGQAFVLGGEERVIPPLALGQVRALAPKLEGIKALSTPDKMAVLGDIIHAALSRNYPEVERAALDDWLDLGNVNDIALAVMGQSGLAEGKATAASA